MSARHGADSSHIFHKDMDERRIPAKRLTALLTRIGRTQPLAHQGAPFGGEHASDAELPVRRKPLPRRRQVRTPHHIAEHDDRRDRAERACKLCRHSPSCSTPRWADHIEQNAAMKLFSWAALMFLPPTLIAGIYGMNFHHMPDCLAIRLSVGAHVDRVSAVVPCFT